MSSALPLAQNAQNLQARYAQLVKSGEIQDDPAQAQVLQLLQTRLDTMQAATPTGWFDRLLGKTAEPAPKGVYIWGNVGRGKSMLMDLFFTQTSIAKKRRVHFHAFMQEVHQRMHHLRQDAKRLDDAGDPVIALARQLAEETRLLCFDELQATDVADATLLYRLFQQLFAAGVMVVSTSNHPPQSLYTGGVQRERFDKFIALIEAHMDIAALSSPKDYRTLQRKSLRQVYFWPLGQGADQFIAQSYKHLHATAHPQSATISVQGRMVSYMQVAPGVGCFTFHDLCESPLGAADYLAIAKTLDTIILTNIPQLGPTSRNEAKRFVTLVDALYEHHATLICTAAVPVNQLYTQGDGAFEFQRTVSRLLEMQSSRYLHEEE